MVAVILRRNLQIWAVGTLAGNMPGPAPFWRSWEVLDRGIGVFAGPKGWNRTGDRPSCLSKPGNPASAATSSESPRSPTSNTCWPCSQTEHEPTARPPQGC